MKKKLLAALSGAAFIYALGIVGAVENGAELSRMIWTIPLLALSFICAAKSFFFSVSKKKNR